MRNYRGADMKDEDFLKGPFLNSAIRSKIEIEVSSVDTTITVPGGPALKIRKASTEFNVRSGQTLVLGGFISRERSRDRDGVPGVANVPLFGRLFSVGREQERHTELAIFVTPVIVDPQHPALAARVTNANGLLQDSFPDPPKLNAPLREFELAQQWEVDEKEKGTERFPLSQWEDSDGKEN